MPNYSSEFCEVIRDLTDEEMEWVNRSLGQRRRYAGCDLFDSQINNGNDLVCWSDEGGHEAFADFAEAFLKQWRLNDVVKLEIAHSCSRMIIHAFGGSACLITAKGQEWMGTGQWMAQKLSEVDRWDS